MKIPSRTARTIAAGLAAGVAVAAALLVTAPAAHADPTVTAHTDGNTITGTYTGHDGPAFVFGLQFPPAEQSNETGISCPGARPAPGGPSGAWECLFRSGITTTSFTIIGAAAWPAGTTANPFVSFDLSTYKTYGPVSLTGVAAPQSSEQSSQPVGQSTSASAARTEPAPRTEPAAATTTSSGSSLTWLWALVIALGLVGIAWGVLLRRGQPAAEVQTQVVPPDLSPGGRWRADENVAIDEGILQGFAALGKQETPGTVSDDIGPARVNPDAPVTPYTPPSADALAAARQWEQDRATEREHEDDPQWYLHNAHRAPNKDLRDWYDKLEQVNAIIAQLEGPQADSVVDHDWLSNSWHEYSTMPLTSSDPLEQAYQWREQLQGLIRLNLGKGGAQSVNLAINEQRNEMLVNTINIESDMAHGTAIGATSGALANTQAGYHPEPGNRVSAPKREGGKAAGGETETGFAPEPETTRMTPEEQGITKGSAPETQTLDATPNAVPDADTVTFEAGRVERIFQEYQRSGGKGDSHAAKVYERWLREQPPEWWDKIQDPATKEYLRSWLGR